MKFIRFSSQGRCRHGVVEGDTIRAISGDPLGDWKFSEQRHRLSEVEILAPFDSSKVIGVGLNYKDHILEFERKGIPSVVPKEPVLFFKSPSAIIASGQAILLPPESARVEYESEIGFIVKRRARRVSREDAHNFIFGYTCVNDVTARDLQRSDVQWTRAKSFDTFCPVGPVVETEFDWRTAQIEGILNGKTVQRSTGAEMVFDPPTLLSYISQCFTLYPGDLVATGTPGGVGPLADGDVFTVRISGIGELTNTVRMERAAVEFARAGT